MTDQQSDWIAAARRGDGRAFGELVRLWHGRVFACCRFHLSNSEDADDAAQETFVRAHQRLEQLREPKRFGSWLKGIARHVCLDAMRRRRPTEPIGAAEQVKDERQPNPAETIQSKDQQALLVALVDELPDDLREVLLLHYFNKMTYDAMADWLDVSRATVNERLRKGREVLRKRLNRLNHFEQKGSTENVKNSSSRRTT